MAAAAALNVVKQIEMLADAPQTAQMRDCLGQLVSSLQCFLDHPDSRVRIGSARTLLKLSRGYNEDFRKNDLTKIETALECLRSMDSIEGSPDADEDTAEFGRLLTESLVLLKNEPPTSNSNAKAGVAQAAAAPTVAASSSTDGRGQVVLQLPEGSDGQTHSAILAKAVAIHGVVSVTSQGPHVIVTTRTADLASDPAFVEDLVSTLASQQGCEGIVAAKRSVTITSPARSTHESSALDAEDEEPEPTLVLDDDDEEPAYLDDDEGADIASPGAGGSPSKDATGPQWSFFAQSSWMIGRRVLEFDDDPTIAARLARARQRAEEKRNEEESRIGAVSRWLGWGRR